jgi:NTE family protein
MGDYIIGYVMNPAFKIADIVAASAGFPILIGPYKLKTKGYIWEKSYFPDESWSPPEDKYLHLWDGGVYDNLGMESIFKPDEGGKLSEGVDFMIVSDASSSLGYFERKGGFDFRGIKRLLDISMDQNRALRSRTIVDYLKREKKGIYIDIGNNVEQIIKKSNSDILAMKPMIKKSLSYADTEKARKYKTTLSRPSESIFDLILRHGYEVAMCTYTCYQN